MSKFKDGDFAVYNSMFAKVLGRIAGFGRDEMGDYTLFKVSSRKNKMYPHGSIQRFYTETNLHAREVRK